MPSPPKQSRELRSTPARAAAIRAEEERALIRQTMSILGSRKSKAKTDAARKNARAAGRPTGSRDTKPRKPYTRKAGTPSLPRPSATKNSSVILINDVYTH